MLKNLKGALVVVVGLLIVAAIIWWGWPILHSAIADEPKHSVLIRLILIGLVIGGWLVYRLVKWLRAKSASSAIMAAVAKSAQKEQPSAEALRLRERFEEAVATLKQSQRRGHSLYELPWYVIIGAPGAGKTTVLVNSGLHFPITQRGQGAALRGIGGTRNCDWWFTDEAVFLDTAGRYTTQDSDAGADSAAWGEFLSLLKKYRQRRPLNGVIVAMSAVDLMTQGQAAREAHVAAVRRRIEELNERLGIRLPIYVLITKCDLIAGFSEYFDDLTSEGRAQVWGVTFPADRMRNAEAAEAYPGELDALVTRLNERVMGRVEDERDQRRRVAAFGFPQQMAALRQPLTQFVSEVFASTKFERAIQLRGVYFTSGTQEGTPIDRLLGALGRRFGMAPEAVAPGSRGKAYFIERLLKEVVVPESGIAGVNRRLELRKGALQLAAYAAMVVCALLMLLLLTVNYAASRDYLKKVESALQSVRATTPVGAASPREAVIRRLDAVRTLKDVAGERYLPLYRAWVLNSGSSAGQAAQDAYASQLNAALVPRVVAGLERRIGPGVQPEELYDALRGYLVLGKEYVHFEKDFFGGVSWDEPGGGDRLVSHLDWLLDRKQALRPVELNGALVRQAQSTMRSVPPERLAYRDVERWVEANSPQKLRIDEQAGIGAERVLRFKSGRPLSYPFPALYTKPVFMAITGSSASQLREIVASRTKYDWVWGEQGAPNLSDTGAVTEKVLDRYEDEYIRTWDEIIGDLTVKSVGSLRSLKDMLNDVTGEGSPLRGVLLLIKEHTVLVEPPKADAKKGVLDSLPIPESVKGRIGGSKTPPRGTRVTEHFAAYHRAVAEVEPLIGTFTKMKEQLATSGDGPGEKPPSPETQASTREMAASLEARAGVLPPALAALAKQIASSARGVVGRNAAGGFQELYRAQVVPECETLVDSRYPFVKDSPRSIPMKDFESLFAYGGVFDRFATDELQKYADITRVPMKWRPDSPVNDEAMLRQFEAAKRIRETFFKAGSKSVEIEFDVKVDDANLRQQGKNKVLFVLELDEHTIPWDQVDRSSVRVKWPGPKSTASASWKTEPPVNLPDAPFEDEWAWLRLVDAGELRRDGAQDTRYVLALKKGARTAEIVIQAANVRNPFGARDALRGFPCGTAAP